MTVTPLRPAAAPTLTARLTDAIDNWSTSQRAVVELAATFADSSEWAAAGVPTSAHWIAGVADIEVCTAREWIRVGRRLRSLPQITDAFERGDISYTKVRVLTRLATSTNEPALLAIAASVSAGQLARAIAAWVGRTSASEALERYQHQQRSVSWRSEPDGMVTFTARLTPLVAGVLIARLTTAVMTSAKRADSLADWPTLAQQHADALETLLREGGGSVVTEVVLHVRGDGCTLDVGTPIPLSAIEKITPDALIRALIHDARGHPVNASHRRRHPTDRQKPQYDHDPDYALSGHTVVDELELRCAPCHDHRHTAAGTS